MKNALRDLPAWGLSLVVNLTILFALSLIVAKVEMAARKLAIDSAMEEQVIEEDYVFKDVTLTDVVGTTGDTQTFTPSASLATTSGPANDVPIERRIEKTFTDIKLPEMEALEALKSNVTAQVNVKGNETEIVTGGVDGVMDRITNELRRSLEENKTVAIWLFDASGSLKDRRDAIADRFDTVYKQLTKLRATDGLHTVVASYGKSASLLTPQPVEGSEIAKLVEAVKNIPEDKSGVENVFTALRLCIDKFKTFNAGAGRANKLVFIVTDERGDDFQMLEEVINLCKQYHFRVFCVGNGAVFGQQKGFVEWKDPSDGEVIFIPVDQGPETSHAQVLQLPFLGGGNYTTISAGFGPYTLSRLCAETGGRYLLAEEAKGDRFDPAVMRNYTPDYRPVRVVEQEIRKNPAMTALVQAAAVTYDPTNSDIKYPETLFRAYNDNILREELREAQKPVAVINYKLNQISTILTAGEKGRPNITDSRWQASFDLAMGRILAMKLRMEGYNRMLAGMSASPRSFTDPQNNMWRLVPSNEIETGPTMRKAADQAREYLKRVIDDHPGTPWALLAEKELSQELGWSWKEERRTVPGMEGRNLSQEEMVRLLLAEDERRMRERTQRQEKKRDIPNL